MRSSPSRFAIMALATFPLRLSPLRIAHALVAVVVRAAERGAGAITRVGRSGYRARPLSSGDLAQSAWEDARFQVIFQQQVWVTSARSVAAAVGL